MPTSDFSSLYTLSYPYLYQLVASIYCNPQFIEDILQEIYLAAWVRFRGTVHPNPFGWLVITARHKAYDMMRRQLRETQNFIPLADEAAVSLPVSSTDTSEKQIDQLLEKEAPYRNLQPLLKDEELSLLVAYYEEGCSVAEISRRLNISDRACYMRLHRAKKKLEPLIRAS